MCPPRELTPEEIETIPTLLAKISYYLVVSKNEGYLSDEGVKWGYALSDIGNRISLARYKKEHSE